MGNAHRAVVDIQATGTPHRLRYDLNAMVELEERFGVTDLVGFGELLQRARLRDIRTLLWLGVRHEAPDITEAEVGAWFGDGEPTVIEATEKIALAIAQAFGVDLDPLDLRAEVHTAMREATSPGTGKKRKRQHTATSA